MGITTAKATLSRYESGQRMPSVVVLRGLAVLYRVEFRQLMAAWIDDMAGDEVSTVTLSATAQSPALRLSAEEQTVLAAFRRLPEGQRAFSLLQLQALAGTADREGSAREFPGGAEGETA